MLYSPRALCGGVLLSNYMLMFGVLCMALFGVWCTSTHHDTLWCLCIVYSALLYTMCRMAYVVRFMVLCDTLIGLLSIGLRTTRGVMPPPLH